MRQMQQYSVGDAICFNQPDLRAEYLFPEDAEVIP
jgi:hypothetical protein